MRHGRARACTWVMLRVNHIYSRKFQQSGRACIPCQRRPWIKQNQILHTHSSNRWERTWWVGTSTHRQCNPTSRTTRAACPHHRQTEEAHVCSPYISGTTYVQLTPIHLLMIEVEAFNSIVCSAIGYICIPSNIHPYISIKRAVRDKVKDRLHIKRQQYSCTLWLFLLFLTRLLPSVVATQWFLNNACVPLVVRSHTCILISKTNSATNQDYKGRDRRESW